MIILSLMLIVTDPDKLYAASASKTKYIAGAVISTHFDMSREGQSAESLKEYVDTQVAQMDAKNMDQN